MIENLLQLLSKDDMDAIHQATLEVFMDPGILVTVPEARQVFKEGGCEVDESTQMVKIPEHVLDQALKTAPSEFVSYARDPKHNLDIKSKGKVHWLNFGNGVKVCDYMGPGKYNTRGSSVNDIGKIAKVVDACDNIDYYLSAVTASDLTGEADTNMHEVIEPMKNLTKHIMLDSVGDNVPKYFDMIKAFYGGDEEEAFKKPILSCATCPTSPLELGYNHCKVTMNCAEINMPSNALSMAMAGASSPIYLAGTLVTHNAEVLSSIVLAQLVNPGAPIWYGSSTTCFDLKKGTAPVGSPELALINAGVAHLGHYYNLPVFVAGA